MTRLTLTESQMSAELRALLERARDHVLTPEEIEEQKRSFAFGNASMSNPDVTRELVEQIAGVNYPGLLLKYIEHVIQAHGNAAIDGYITDVRFSPAERSELERMVAKVAGEVRTFGTPEHAADFIRRAERVLGQRDTDL